MSLQPRSSLTADVQVKESGSDYAIDTGSMHRETSWWMVEQLTGIQPETMSIKGQQHVGCHGIGIGG